MLPGRKDGDRHAGQYCLGRNAAERGDSFGQYLILKEVYGILVSDRSRTRGRHRLWVVVRGMVSGDWSGVFGIGHG